MTHKPGYFWWNAQIFLRLVQRNILVALPTYKRRIINIALLTAAVVYVFEYIGLAGATGCGLFIAASEVSIKGFMRVHATAFCLLSDILGDRSISYYLTLPIPSSLVFLALGIASTVELLVINAVVLPVAKIILGSRFHLSWQGCMKVTLLFLCAHFFYGMLTFLYVGYASSLEALNSIRARIVEVVYWMGGGWFSWKQLYHKIPWVAYVDLLNPLIYASEGMRAALFGQEGYLSYWLCCGVLFLLTLLFGIIGIRRMKVRLDCL